MATENIIGTYLKQSRCNASTIELIDVLFFIDKKNREEKAKEGNENISVKAQDIISEWDDDASQDSDESKMLSKENEVSDF